MISRFSWLAVFLSFIAAAVLEVVVLPDSLLMFRPEWLALTLIYWLLRHPAKVGISTAVVFGVVMDIISGTTLGIHVLAYSVTAYLVLSMHQRLKMFPVIQQSLVVFFLVSIHLMIVYILSMVLHDAEGGLSYLWLSLTSALMWPLVLILTDRLALFLR